MALWTAEKYQREVADAFVNWSVFYWGGYWFVRTKCCCEYLYKPSVEYVDGKWIPVVARDDKKLCVVFSREADSGIVRMRVNAILKRYWLGEVKREKTKRVYYSKEWEVVPRNEWKRRAEYLKRVDGDYKRVEEKEKYLIFDIKTIEFTFVSI